MKFQNVLMKGWGRVCLDSLAAAALGAAAFFAVEALMPSPADALGRCKPFDAYRTMDQVLQGGGSWSQAWEAASMEGQYDGGEICLLRVKGMWRQIRMKTIPSPG